MNRATLPPSLHNTAFALQALEMQADLDAVLRKHNCYLAIEHTVSSLRFQVRFNEHANAALTFIHRPKHDKRGTFGYRPEPLPEIHREGSNRDLSTGSSHVDQPTVGNEADQVSTDTARRNTPYEDGSRELQHASGSDARPVQSGIPADITEESL